MNTDFFFTEYQLELEKVEFLMSKEADPSRPYDFKYEARTILQNLQTHPALSYDFPISKCGRGIIEYL